jgi:hypothetical protein
MLACGRETISAYFIGAGSTVRLLLTDYDLNDLNYTITIEETSMIPSYTTLDYSTVIPVNGSPVQGSITAQDNTYLGMWNIVATGKGFSFTPQAGKTYKITCQYEALQAGYIDAGLYILKGGALKGNSDDILSNNWGHNTKITVAFNSGDGSTIRLLLKDDNLYDLSYEITIEEVNIPSYAAIDYLPLTVGTPVTGTLSATANEIVSGSGFANGQGYTFAVEAGKVYNITCAAPEGSNVISGFWIGTFEENDNDFIPCLSIVSSSMRTNTYFATSNGNIRILLTSSDLSNDLPYSIEVNCITDPPTDYQFSKNN